MKPIKYGLMAAVPLSIIVFALFISSSTSNLIAFAAYVIACFFIALSMLMLGEIMEKPQGPKSMIEIADTIREGSEGFFMT